MSVPANELPVQVMLLAIQLRGVCRQLVFPLLFGVQRQSLRSDTADAKENRKVGDTRLLDDVNAKEDSITDANHRHPEDVEVAALLNAVRKEGRSESDEEGCNAAYQLSVSPDLTTWTTHRARKEGSREACEERCVRK